MAVYAIGDLQGCYDPLQRLLDAIAFDPANDTLWLTGDLVNRGPKSLKTLRFVKALGDAAIAVLGNHDLHLLALAAGKIRGSRRLSSLRKVLDAPDSGELIDWLRHRPLAHYEPLFNSMLVHAGVHPRWNAKKTLELAGNVETALQGNQYATFLGKMYGNTPTRWSEDLTGYKRLRFIVNCLTRMRMMTITMRMNFSHSGPPHQARKNLVPWYESDKPAWSDTRIIFGHWSALGLIVLPGLISLDTGCIWGRQLTAARLDKRITRIVQVAGQQQR